MTLRTLTPGETKVIEHLADAWNAFITCAPFHGDDLAEFRRGIHHLQEKVFARPAIEHFNRKGGNDA
ncbi:MULTISPECIES: hypothetical protein [Agrobacterium]|uniref:hypothetical protein n=1 Tax=Agrobacterium TaxID=357 RepID=UPI002301E5AC|nr:MULTISPECIES: hypothetical protein [Agrobacterium]MDA5627845.1 hypothetical protein [Agrobacterium sp. ST15.16.055]MDA6978409.1 hypothetical protein [Agrobacterium salinitolerans]